MRIVKSSESAGASWIRNPFQNRFEESVHQYLDERELQLWADIELDMEVLKEVSALFRVVKFRIAKPAVKPMPDIIKRMFYLKREIYQIHKQEIEQKR